MSKTVYLLRHAKAEPHNFAIRDFERNLAVKGRTDAHMMGTMLKSRISHETRILASPALRTKQTAEIFASAMQLVYPITFVEEMYNAPYDTYKKILLSLHDEFNEVMFIGHNPGISLALENFSGEQDLDMPTCAIGKIELPIDAWAMFTHQSGSLAWFEYPARYRV